jgi:hypothetical protein
MIIVPREGYGKYMTHLGMPVLEAANIGNIADGSNHGHL